MFHVSICSFFNHLCCLLVTILCLNQHVKMTGTRKKLCSIGSRRGLYCLTGLAGRGGTMTRQAVQRGQYKSTSVYMGEVPPLPASPVRQYNPRREPIEQSFLRVPVIFTCWLRHSIVTNKQQRWLKKLQIENMKHSSTNGRPSASPLSPGLSARPWCTKTTERYCKNGKR